MKKTIIAAILSLLTVGLLAANGEIISEEAYASFYGEAFNGKPTANGEIFNMNAYTAAHKTLPFGTFVEVTNLENGKKVIVRINDRGPFIGNREIDLSKAAAGVLDMLAQGVVRVKIKKINTNDVDSFIGYTSKEKKENQNTPSTYSQSNNEALVEKEPESIKNKNLVYTPARPEETSGPLWRIQLGAFKREENAMRLVIQLRKIGFEPAYEKTENNTRVVLYGIRPEDLEKVKKVLELNSFKDYILKQENW